MPYEIETGIEIPNTRSKYPWDTMGVGESFFIPGKQRRVIIPRRLKDRKFIQAIMPKDGSGSGTTMGLRVKRVG